jgi:dihydrofolate reductase
MGKATWDSLPVKPLPNRVNVVVSSSNILAKVDVVSISDLRRRMSSMDTDQDVWIIGGARLIEGMMDYIDEFHLSQIKGNYNCDTFLPSTLIQENYSLTSSQFQGDVYVDVWSKR